jgi:hypothetical protein
VVNNVLDGQAHSVVIDIEATSQLSVALPDFSAKWIERFFDKKNAEPVA